MRGLMDGNVSRTGSPADVVNDMNIDIPDSLGTSEREHECHIVPSITS